MRIFRPFLFARWIYPEASFRISVKEKLIALTFDDGPDPSSTPILLDVLHKNEIKAHFFCNGSAAEKYPDLVEHIVSEGHITGNHSYSHLDGWTRSVRNYTLDVERASVFTSDKWFRPPYGRLRLLQYYKLKRKYKIVFWDLMPYDFDTTFPEEKSLEVLSSKIRPGSIIVMHDRYRPSLYQYMNRFIENSIHSGYRFVLLNQF